MMSVEDVHEVLHGGAFLWRETVDLVEEFCGAHGSLTGQRRLYYGVEG